MNKAQLIDVIAQRAELSKAQTETVLQALIASITQALQEGQPVTILGFGTFVTRKRAARRRRNPKTGETMEIAASIVPAFKPGKALKAAVRNAVRRRARRPIRQGPAVAQGLSRQVEALDVPPRLCRAALHDACWARMRLSSRRNIKVAIAAWRRDYNEVRPHSALGKQTPAQFAAMLRERGALETNPASDKLATLDSTK